MYDIVEQYKNKKIEIETKLSLVTEQIEEKEKSITKLETEAELYRTCSTILTKLVGERTETLKTQIESIVNEGLNAVFGDELSIRITSSIKRNKTEYHIDIIHKDVVGDQESFGGGVLAVVSLCLRIVSIIICNADRVLFLDESLAFVSEKYQPKLSFFLSKICKNLDFNIILISHQPKMAMYATRVYEAYRENGATNFKESIPERSQ